jgi:hypothetical protein
LIITGRSNNHALINRESQKTGKGLAFSDFRFAGESMKPVYKTVLKNLAANTKNKLGLTDGNNKKTTSNESPKENTAQDLSNFDEIGKILKDMVDKNKSTEKFATKKPKRQRADTVYKYLLI